MWFWPISATVSAFEHAHAVKRAAVEQHAHEAPVVARGRGEAAAADRRRYGEPKLRLLQFNGAVHALAGALLLLRRGAAPLPPARCRRCHSS
jgi:hypothetical protein